MFVIEDICIRQRAPSNFGTGLPRTAKPNFKAYLSRERRKYFSQNITESESDRDWIIRGGGIKSASEDAHILLVGLLKMMCQLTTSADHARENETNSSLLNLSNSTLELFKKHVLFFSAVTEYYDSQFIPLPSLKRECLSSLIFECLNVIKTLF